MGDSLLLASGAETVKLWQPPSFTLMSQYEFSAPSVAASLCWSPSGRSFMCVPSLGHQFTYFLVSGSKIGGADVRSFNSPEPISCAAFGNTTSRILGLGCKSGKVHVWDMKNKKSSNIYSGHSSAVSCLTFNHGDGYIASGSCNGNLLLYNLRSSQGFMLRDANQKIQPSCAICKVQYNKNKKSLLGVASSDGSICLWDTNKREVVTRFADAHVSPTTSFVFSPLNCVFLISIGLDKRICCYDLNAKKKVRTITSEAPLESIDIMPNGRTIAVGSTRGKIYIYDLSQSSVPLETIDAHTTGVTCLAFQTPQESANGIPRDSTNSATDKKGLSEFSWESEKPLAKSYEVPNAAELPDDHLAANILRKGEEDANVFSPLRLLSCNTTTSSSIGNASQGNSLLSPLAADLDDGKQEAFSPHSSAFEKRVMTEKLETSQLSHPSKAGAFDVSPFLSSDAIFSSPNFSEFGTRNLSSHSQLPVLSPSVDKHHSFDLFSPIVSGNPDTIIDNPEASPSSPFIVHQDSKSTNAQTTPFKQSSPSQTSATKSPEPGTKWTDLLLPLAERQSIHSDAPVPSTPCSSHPAPSESIKMRNVSAASKLYLEINGNMNLDRERVPSAKLPSPNRPAADKKESPDVRSMGDGVDSGASGISTPHAFQMEFIKQMIQDSIEELRYSIHKDYMKLHVEMVKQFQIQLYEFQNILQNSVNADLLQEIERLREENRQLRSNF